MTEQPTSEIQLDSEHAAVVARILETHKLLVSIAQNLRRLDDFDHAMDMSDAAMFCRAAYNDIRLGKNTRKKTLRKRDAT